MPLSFDLLGQRFGRLVVLGAGEQRNKQRYWNCLCDCGRVAIARGDHLRRGATSSCGCVRTEQSKINVKAMHRANTIHGEAKRGAVSREYGSWHAMLQRCENPKHHAFKNYGGRGITVCERWWSLPNFIADMGPRPSGKTLDRIDNDGNYEPGNCRWATPKEQIANQRRPVHA